MKFIVRKHNSKNGYKNIKYKYSYPKGGEINSNILNYVKSLKIAPAYNPVKISLNKKSKVIAKGLDAKGRWQYIYNETWIDKRNKVKYCRMQKFGKKVKKIQKDILSNLKSRKIDKEKLICIVLRIMMTCHFRVGNKKYRKDNNSYGITTLTKKHIKFKGKEVEFSFMGKSGVHNKCQTDDIYLVKSLKMISKKRRVGNYFFKIIDKGKKIEVNSSDINDYLKKFGNFTSKDFRTWYANLYFIEKALEKYKNNEMLDKKEEEIINPRKRKQISNSIVKEVAKKLHHTVNSCKKSYLDKHLLDLFINSPIDFNRLIVRKLYRTKKNNRFENVLLDYFENKKC